MSSGAEMATASAGDAAAASAAVAPTPVDVAEVVDLPVAAVAAPAAGADGAADAAGAASGLSLSQDAAAGLQAPAAGAAGAGSPKGDVPGVVLSQQRGEYSAIPTYSYVAEGSATQLQAAAAHSTPRWGMLLGVLLTFLAIVIMVTVLRFSSHPGKPQEVPAPAPAVRGSSTAAPTPAAGTAEPTTVTEEAASASVAPKSSTATVATTVIVTDDTAAPLATGEPSTTGTGASSTTGAGKLSTSSSAALAFDCTLGTSTRYWSIYKKAWCCSNFGLGCPHSSQWAAGVAGSFDCEAGLASWRTSWSEEKKSWCCLHEGQGCDGEVPWTPPPPTACDTDCLFLGTAHRCKDRVQWAARHDFAGAPDACKLSLNMVIKQCAGMCDACTLQDASCEAPPVAPEHDCSSDFPLGDWQHSWSLAKKAWCCQHVGRGCPRLVSVPYDCTFDFLNRQKSWSEEKKEWCCDNENMCD